MGKFTKYDEPQIDHQIESQLRNIIDIIRENVPNVRSILLSGSFGRGEGSVEIVNNKVTPLKDFDIYVIVNKIPSQSCKDLLNKKISLNLGLPVNPTSKFAGFHVDVSFYTEFLLRSYPDIVRWELKHASLLRYGEDARFIIPWKIEDIPLFNGLRFLFEKATGLTAYFSNEYVINGSIGEEKSKLLIYECYKTYVEIVSVLCLAMGCYEPSYKTRLALFRKKIKQELPDLYKKAPKLEEYAAKGTEFKLKPRFGNVEENISELWFQTRDTLCEVLKYYFRKSLNVEVNSFTASYEELRKAMAYQYYKPFVRALLATLGFHNEFLTKTMNQLFLMYQKLGTVLRLVRKERTLYLRPIFQLQSPLMTVYLTSILVLLSLKRSGEVDAYYSQEALKNLSKVIPLKTERVTSWNDLRDLYVKAYEMHRGGPK